MNWETILTTIRDVLDITILTLAGTPITVGTALTFILLILASVRGSRLVAHAVAHSPVLTTVADTGARDATERLLRQALLWLGVLIAIGFLGVDLAALFTAGAVFAVGVGLALQNIARDLVSGLLLTMERRIKPGDVLAVNDRIVRVVDMGVRATVVRSLDDEDIIIPNGDLTAKQVINYTHRDSLYRVRARIGVDYGSDLSVVTEALLKAASCVAGQATGVEPRLLFWEFSTDAVVFDVSVWIDNPWRSPRVRSELYETAWWALRDAGVKIAFRQVRLHQAPAHAQEVTPSTAATQAANVDKGAAPKP